MSATAEIGSNDEAKLKAFIGMLCSSINDDGDKRYEIASVAQSSISSTHRAASASLKCLLHCLSEPNLYSHLLDMLLRMYTESTTL